MAIELPFIPSNESKNHLRAFGIPESLYGVLSERQNTMCIVEFEFSLFSELARGRFRWLQEASNYHTESYGRILRQIDSTNIGGTKKLPIILQKLPIINLL